MLFTGSRGAGPCALVAEGRLRVRCTEGWEVGASGDVPRHFVLTGVATATGALLGQSSDGAGTYGCAWQALHHFTVARCLPQAAGALVNASRGRSTAMTNTG